MEENQHSNLNANRLDGKVAWTVPTIVETDIAEITAGPSGGGASDGFTSAS